MLKIALPGGKSLEERTYGLFTEAGITIAHKDSTHMVTFPDYPSLTVGYFLKPRRIPLLVAEGDFDVGITGMDVVLESSADVVECTRLPYSRSTQNDTQGILFAHQSDSANSFEEVPDDSVILSEYPNLTRDFFAKIGKNVEVVESPGSAEAEVPLKYRFGVALSETGRSLRENNLKCVGKVEVFKSYTALIANEKALAHEEKAEAIHALKLILQGVLEARDRVLLSMNVPVAAMGNVLQHLSALRSPTIAPLAGGQFSSVSVVMHKWEVNGLVPSLLKMGAEGLIIMPISSVIQSW
jgi:ATP phosphoribosyltransferase